MSKDFQESEATALKSYTDWLSTCRPKQLAPQGDYLVWLILAGRGWGKTRTGAQDIVSYAMRNPNVICAVVAPTLGDLRRTCIEGPSGILACLPEACLAPSKGSAYNSRTGEINLWNGSKILGFSANEPDRMRGPQYHRAWCDELAAWRYEDAWDQLQFGLRLGDDPKCVITTTPRPTRLVKNLAERDGKDVHITSGSTFENLDNLASSAIQGLKERYEGTRLGRQELYAEVLTDVEGALWSFTQIEQCKVGENDLPEFNEIVVAVDPAVTANENSDETGIVVCAKGVNSLYYVLEDVSGVYSPDAWARKAIDMYYKYQANKVVCEVNQGGDLVTKTVRDIDERVYVKGVRASRGKLMRAEPIAALYEQERVKHVGNFTKLEDQMTTYDGRDASKSPDRLDALVWGLTELSESSGTVYWRIN